MTDQLLHNTLQVIFTLSRATLPVDATAIARIIGTSPMRIAEALVVLEQRGWVDASRARLTMLGLAKAVANGVPQTRATAGHTAPRMQVSNGSRRRGRGRDDSRPYTPAVTPVEERLNATSVSAARVQH